MDLKTRIRRTIDWRLSRLKRRMRLQPPLTDASAFEDKRFVFFCGLHRSGTSIIHRLIRENPGVTAFEDTGMPEDEGQFLQTVFPPKGALWAPGRFALDPRARLTETSPLATAENRQLLLRQWGAYLDPEKPVVLEKSPPNLVRTRLLQALVPNAHFVFILRHPLGVGGSTGQFAGRTVPELMLHWWYAHLVMLEDRPFLTSSTVVRYEDLVAAPQDAVEAICRSAGLTPHTPEESVRDGNARHYAAWQVADDSVRDSIRLLQGQTDLFGQFGYSFEEPFVRPPRIDLA